jgi:voltage-gated potassium channel
VSIVVMLMGASMYAFMIGTIASVIANLDARKARFFEDVADVARYLQARRVPGEVSYRVSRYYDFLWEQHRGVPGGGVLGELPGPLRLELLQHAVKDTLARVPLFAACSPSLQNSLLLELKPMVLGPGALLVRDGDVPHEVFFLSAGSAEVLDSDGAPVAVFESGDLFGLLSLTLGERRTGSVRTLSFCDLYVLEAGALERLKAEHPELRDILRRLSSEKSAKTANLLMEGVTI